MAFPPWQRPLMQAKQLEFVDCSAPPRMLPWRFDEAGGSLPFLRNSPCCAKKSVQMGKTCIIRLEEPDFRLYLGASLKTPDSGGCHDA